MEMFGNVVWGGVSPRINKTQIKCIYPIVQGDLLGNSTDMDVYYKCTGGMEVQKYLRERFYYCIECSVPNSLAALMRKWSLNSVFQPYSYPQKLQKGADGTKININNLLSTWKVKVRRKRWYKLERKPWDRRLEKKRETL